MDKKSAIESMKALIARGFALDPTTNLEALREGWRLDCLAVLERVFGPKSRQLDGFSKVSWMPDIYGENEKLQRQREVEARKRGRIRSLTILESALNEVVQFWELDKSTVDIDPFRLIERLCENFHAVARQLRHRRSNRPTLDVNDEYDVQDLI